MYLFHIDFKFDRLKWLFKFLYQVYSTMSHIQVVSVGQGVFLERKPHRRKAASEQLLIPTAVSQYDAVYGGLPCISQITETKKTCFMSLTPPAGYKLLSIL